jgi:hypothetical protein
LRVADLFPQTRVIAVARDGADLELYPRRDTGFGAGDTVYLVGPYHKLLTTLRRGQVGHPRRASPPMTSIADGLGISGDLK